MTTRRPGAPRSAGRPVGVSGGGRVAAGARGSGSGRASSRPASAARPRAAAARVEEQDGPLVTLSARALVLVAIIVIALATVVPTLNTYVAQRQQLAALQEQVTEQRSQLDEVQRRVDRWEDPTFVAAQARERLLYAMPGETQYRLMDSSGQAVPITEAQQEAAEAAQGEWFTTLWQSVEGASRAGTGDATGPASLTDPTDPTSPEDTAP